MAASAAAASLLPSSMSSALTRPHATTDSRLLQNLIKSEKTYVTHLASAVQSSSAAAAALKAWGTSESRDVAQASSVLADLLEEVADAQNNHLEAIKGYREALKDVADREASIRTIVKDRDILVSRLIKASRKNGDVPHAQRELTACEEVLEAEERALVGVKRRTFKEALSMRMKLMGDAGNRMIECAKESILLLDEFDQHAAGDDRRSFTHHTAGHEYGTEDYYNHQATGYPDQQPPQEAWAQQTGDADAYHQQQQYHHQHASPDMHLASLEAASVTPSQSASQTAHGSRIPAAGYQRPAFPDGAPRESAEERADSDASSEADGDREYADARAQLESYQSPQVEAPPIPSKDGNQAHYFPSTEQHYHSHQEPVAAPPLRPARETRPVDSYSHPAPQMHVATAPRFNYDGTQLEAVPQAPRLYNRDNEDSSDDEEPRNATAHQGWSSRPTRGAQDSSDEEGPRGAPRGTPGRPKNEKRSSFLGKVGRLFKTDLKEGDQDHRDSGKGHRRQSSYSERGSFQMERSQPENTGWQSRTDRNLKASQRESVRALGGQQTKRQTLLHPLSHQRDDSSSDDEDRRADLVRHVNPAFGGRKATSDVGQSLKRTPSQQHSITAGPLSARQRREQEEREQAEQERKARDAVLGAGVGGLSRSNTVRSSATAGTGTIKKKKKKTASKRPGSIAESEIGTSATRSAPLVTAVAPAPQRPGSYIVSGDLSSGNRGLASLVLPSDIAKDQERVRAGYPSQLQPPSGSGLTRSNSTATTATVKSATKKKKKRQSAISEGHGTGLTSMSPKDQGKYTTNNWVQSNQPAGGTSRDSGLAASAVANAGLVPHSPASQEQIAKKQASTGLSIPRPSSAQSTPLKSALKHHSHQQSISSDTPKPTPRAPEASLGPAVHAPPSASAVLAEQARPPLPPVAAHPPVLPSPQPNISTPMEEKRQTEAVPNLSQDQTIDGSGRFLSRQNSAADGLAVADYGYPNGNAGAGPRAEDRKPKLAPKIDMPSSEPFNIDIARLEEQRRGPAAVTAADLSSDSAALTPNETATYQKWIESAPAAAESSPAAAATAPNNPLGVSRVTANRHRIGSSVDLDNEQASEKPLMPSRTYSNEGKTLHTARSGGGGGGPPSSLAATLMLPSSTSGGHSDLSAGTADSGIVRRKSVRIAPDTKLPPETPPAQGDGNGPMSDGFGGFVSPYTTSTLHQVSAPGSSLSRSGSVNKEQNDRAGQQHHQQHGPSDSQLSSRIAPPPQAPPRLPHKETNPHLSNERERAGWSTRTDRRLASGYDSSDDEDNAGGGMGGTGSGEGVDAYASARRAMGMAQRHWTDATSPARKKSTTKKTTGNTTSADTGSVRSKSSKKKSAPSSSGSGYNKDIPLPKGMEVVGRQKASKA